jgi:nucleotide-binding universal stress UspA family protein
MKTLTSQTRIVLKNILFATDFSAAADAALPFAIQMARRYGASVHGVHVRPFELYGGVPPASWPVLAEEAEKAAKENTRRLEEELRDVPHNVVVGQGDIWEVLAAVIQENDIDLIVIGTRGRTGIEKMVLGSVAEEIFRRASCPVMTVGPHASRDAERAVKMGEILYPTDFTAESLAAAPYAVSLAQENQAHLTLLHVCEKGKAGDLVDPGHFVDPTLRMLRSLVPEDAGLWCEPECAVEKGDPAAKILDVAEKRHADLIVLGVRRAHGVPGAATHLGGALAHKIVAYAECPVLTVRG